MKRDHRDTCTDQNSSKGEYSSSTSSVLNGKAKIWEQDQDGGGGIDELLAVLGYKVWASDMAEVAEKLEQLEMVMGSAQEDGISQLSDTVHYNPSDLSGWVQSMLSEFNMVDGSAINDPLFVAADSSSITSIHFSNSHQRRQGQCAHQA